VFGVGVADQERTASDGVPWGLPFAMFSLRQPDAISRRPELVELKRLIVEICSGEKSLRQLATQYNIATMVESFVFEDGCLRQETMA
jgi:hypothetical protein